MPLLSELTTSSLIDTVKFDGDKLWENLVYILTKIHDIDIKKVAFRIMLSFSKNTEFYEYNINLT